MTRSNRIREARVRARLNQTDVARSICRSQRWLSAVELGQLNVSTEAEKTILLVIYRLQQFRRDKRRRAEQVISESEIELCQDLNLSAV